MLSLFENPLNMWVLKAHRVGPRRLMDLQEEISWAAQSTLRTAITGLCEIGALARETIRRTPYAVATQLTEVGTEILAVGEQIDAWLKVCPAGAIAPRSEEAKVALKALHGGWSSNLIRALAAGPCTLTELASLIPHVSYPALDRRLQWMRLTGQIEPLAKESRGTPYAVTDWLRQAIGPLAAAARCERRHLLSDSGPITRIEVEAAFLLTLPLAPLPPEAEGDCVFAVQVEPTLEDREMASGFAGTAVEIKRGSVVSCKPTIAAEPFSWAVGSPEAWLEAVIEGRLGELRIGGCDPQLAADVVSGIHFALFTDR